MRKKEGTNEWMIETEYQRMVAIAPNKATHFEAVAKYWKKSIVLALFELWQKLNCVQRLFLYSSTRSETILPVAQSRLSLHRSLCVWKKKRSHRLNPRWLQKTLQLSFILDMKFPKWLKSGNAYNLISFSSMVMMRDCIHINVGSIQLFVGWTLKVYI